MVAERPHPLEEAQVRAMLAGLYQIGDARRRIALAAQLLELLTSHGYRRPWPEMGRVDDWYVRG